MHYVIQLLISIYQNLTLKIDKLATAASDIVSFLPKDLADIDL